MKIIKIHEKLFDAHIIVIGNCSSEDFYKLCKKWGKNIPDENDGNSRGMFVRFKRNPRWILWVEKFSRKNELLAVLCHELVHLCVALLDDRGIPIYYEGSQGDHGDETLAYLYEFIFKEILKKI